MRSPQNNEKKDASATARAASARHGSRETTTRHSATQLPSPASSLIFRGHKTDEGSQAAHLSDNISKAATPHCISKLIDCCLEEFSPLTKGRKERWDKFQNKEGKPSPDRWMPSLQTMATDKLTIGSNSWAANQGTGAHLPALSQVLLCIFTAPSPCLLDGNFNPSSPHCAAMRRASK